MKTFQLTSPDQLRFPLVHSLIHRGMREFGTVDIDLMSDTVLMTFDDEGHPKAFVIIYFPMTSKDQGIPQIVHFHSEGGRSLTRHLVGKTLDFVKKKGYNRLRAVNGSGASDKVWERVFRHPEWNLKPAATVFDFEVKK